jgi:hypothetical protein
MESGGTTRRSRLGVVGWAVRPGVAGVVAVPANSSLPKALQTAKAEYPPRPYLPGVFGNERQISCSGVGGGRDLRQLFKHWRSHRVANQSVSNGIRAMSRAKREGSPNPGWRMPLPLSEKAASKLAHSGCIKSLPSTHSAFRSSGTLDTHSLRIRIDDSYNMQLPARSASRGVSACKRISL